MLMQHTVRSNIAEFAEDLRMVDAENRHAPLFVISVAAELAGMHPQTLRQYDRMGLVTPRRQGGKHRRYSPYDIEQLRQIQQLSQEGVSLEGIRRILQLQNRVDELEDTVSQLRQQLRQAQRNPGQTRIFAVGPHGDVVSLSRGQRPRPAAREIVLWQDRLPRSPHDAFANRHSRAQWQTDGVPKHEKQEPGHQQRH